LAGGSSYDVNVFNSVYGGGDPPAATGKVGLQRSSFSLMNNGIRNLPKASAGGSMNEKNSKSIIMGSSTDITFATPYGGFIAEKGTIAGKEFISYGKAFGLEASISFNILVLFPKEDFDFTDIEGLGYSFSANYLKVLSSSLSGNSRISYPANTFGNSYFLFKIGLGIGYGGSYQETNTEFFTRSYEPDIFYNIKTLKFF